MSEKHRPVRLTASVQMGMATGGSHPEGVWRIQVGDELSGVHICTIEMTPEQFAQGLGTRYQPAIAVELTHPEILVKFIGKRRENKSVQVFIGKARSIEDVRTLAKAYEADGWTASDLRSFNNHRLRGDHYDVSFVRHVDPSTPPYVEPKPEPKAKGRKRS